ncbi:hypothetical protein ACO1O0_009204 [Amphichorda felina]
MLLSSGAKLQQGSFAILINKQDVGVFQELLDHSFDINTPAIVNEIPTLDLLLANSAKMQASILHLAMRPTAYGEVDMVKYLILHGADVNHCDANSGTPLHCAAYFGLKDVVSEFLDAGVDPGMLVDSSTLANLGKQHDNLEVHELLVVSPRSQIKSSDVRQG